MLPWTFGQNQHKRFAEGVKVIPEGSLRQRVAEQIVDAPFPQCVEVVMYAVVNEVTVAVSPELAPDVELDETRQRIRLRLVFERCLGRACRPRAPSRKGRGAKVVGSQPDCQEGEEGKTQMDSVRDAPPKVRVGISELDRSCSMTSMNLR